MIGPADYFASKVLAALDTLMADVQAAILAGAVPDFPSYRMQIGRLQGLSAARNAVVDLIGADDMAAVEHAANSRRN